MVFNGGGWELKKNPDRLSTVGKIEDIIRIESDIRVPFGSSTALYSLLRA